MTEIIKCGSVGKRVSLHYLNESLSFMRKWGWYSGESARLQANRCGLGSIPSVTCGFSCCFSYLLPGFFPPALLFWIFKLFNFNAPISFNLIFFFDFSWTPLAWMRTFKESMRVSENILREVWHPYERSLLKILKSTGQIMSELCRWESKNFWTS